MEFAGACAPHTGGHSAIHKPTAKMQTNANGVNTFQEVCIS